MMFFFFNDTATTEIYTLSLHDALPICEEATFVAGGHAVRAEAWRDDGAVTAITLAAANEPAAGRSEEHTSELQSRQYLVCRLLLEKKKKNVMSFHAPKLTISSAYAIHT